MHPLIDLNPGDETCIYSTLLYVDNEAKCLGSPVSTLLKSVTATDTNHMPTVESSATNITGAPLVSVRDNIKFGTDFQQQN